MASYYVRSLATGTGDGSSWTNAYTSLSSAMTALNGTVCTFFVSEDHNETTSSANLTLPATSSSSYASQVLCVNHTGSVPPVSADLRSSAILAATGANGISISGGTAYWYGIIFQGGSGATTKGFYSGGYNQVFENCSIQKLGTTANSAGIYFTSTVEFRNTSFSFGNVGDSLNSSGGIIWKNTSTPVLNTLPTLLFSGAQFVSIENVDFSAFKTGKTVYSPTLQAGTSGGLSHSFKDCAIGAGSSFVSTPSGLTTAFNLSRCDTVGTNYRESRYAFQGTQVDELTVVMTGGATDGYTRKSRNITTTANTSWPYPFEISPSTIWNDTTNSITATMFGIWFGKTVVPTNDQVWFDLEYLGSASSSLGVQASGTKSNVLANGVALSSSTRAWDSLAAVRANSTAYTIGQIISVTSAPGQLYRCTTSGTSASTAPSGYASTADGASINDGTAVFQAAVRFQQTLTFTAGQKGLVYAHPKVALPSTTNLYLDPIITLV